MGHGAAAFYDLDGTLVRTNLVHAFLYAAKNQQGVVKSVLKTAYTMASVPLFLGADMYGRRLFNDVFFVRYKGESEDRLRYLADELFDNGHPPLHLPGRVRAHRQVEAARAAPGPGRPAPSTSRCGRSRNTWESTTM